MRLKVFISSRVSKRTRYVLSDSPTIAETVEASISSEDLISYLTAKQEYERWQERMMRAKRYGGGWI